MANYFGSLNLSKLDKLKKFINEFNGVDYLPIVIKEKKEHTEDGEWVAKTDQWGRSHSIMIRLKKEEMDLAIKSGEFELKDFYLGDLKLSADYASKSNSEKQSSPAGNQSTTTENDDIPF